MSEFERGRDAAIEHITNLLRKDSRLVLHVVDDLLTWTILPEEPHTYLPHPKEQP